MQGICIRAGIEAASFYMLNVYGLRSFRLIKDIAESPVSFTNEVRAKRARLKIKKGCLKTSLR